MLVHMIRPTKIISSIHPLYLRALLPTHIFYLGTYNLFALLYLVFLLNISDWYVKSSFMYVGVRLCKVLYRIVTVLNFTGSRIDIT